MSTVIEQAYALLNRGLPEQGAKLLEAGGSQGDGACWLELAVWNLTGRHLPRNLRLAREYFLRAGKAGIDQGMMIYLSFLALGVGGDRDWAGALQHLRTMAVRGVEGARRLVNLIDAMVLDEVGDPAEIPVGRTLSKSPDVRVFEGLLSADECRYLTDYAAPFMEPSVIVDPATGRFRPHPVRTSEAAGLAWTEENPVVHAINRRIAAASGTIVEAGEPLQVLRYGPGQEYKPHLDSLPGTDNQRIFTMLVTLTDGFEGGETYFPAADFTFKGKIGDGLLFRNALANGEPDPASVHAGLPVRSGRKQIATRWIHQRCFMPLV